jgi:hypothetical protein
MIAIPKRWRQVAVMVTALAATAVLVGAGPTTAATTAAKVSPDQKPRCITFDYVEPTTIVASSVPLDNPTPAIGTQVALLDHINNWSGTQVGSSIAAVDILYTDAATGHLMEYSSETMNFPNGSLFSGGTYDRTAIVDLDWVSAPISGIGGIYLGYSGTFYWRVLSMANPWPVEDKVVVCRH